MRGQPLSFRYPSTLPSPSGVLTRFPTCFLTQSIVSSRVIYNSIHEPDKSFRSDHRTRVLDRNDSVSEFQKHSDLQLSAASFPGFRTTERQLHRLRHKQESDLARFLPQDALDSRQKDRQKRPMYRYPKPV